MDRIHPKKENERKKTAYASPNPLFIDEDLDKCPVIYKQVYVDSSEGVFSPVCFLSTVLGGGMSIGTNLSISRENLSFKKSFALGGFCGLCAD